MRLFVVFALVCSWQFALSMIYDTSLRMSTNDFFITKETAKTHFRMECLKLIKTRKSDHPRYREQYVIAANLMELMESLRYMDAAGEVFETALDEVATAFINVSGIDYVDEIYKKIEENLKEDKGLYDEYVRLGNQSKHESDLRTGKSVDDNGNPVWIRAVLSNCFLIESKRPNLPAQTRFKTRRERILVSHLVIQLSKDPTKGPAIQKIYESAIEEVARDYAKSYSINTDAATKAVVEKLKLKLEADSHFSEDLQLTIGSKNTPKKA